MPKIREKSIDAHRHAVREAALDGAAALISSRGLTALTMSGIAQEAGIGRATLYKYFPDVEAVIHAWHERQINRHLEVLAAIAAGDGSPLERVGRVLESYTALSRHDHDAAMGALLHRRDHVVHAREHLAASLSHLMDEGMAAGKLRDDMPSTDLAGFCLGAVAAAREASEESVERMVDLILSALRPPT